MLTSSKWPRETYDSSDQDLELGDLSNPRHAHFSDFSNNPVQDSSSTETSLATAPPLYTAASPPGYTERGHHVEDSSPVKSLRGTYYARNPANAHESPYSSPPPSITTQSTLGNASPSSIVVRKHSSIRVKCRSCVDSMGPFFWSCFHVLSPIVALILGFALLFAFVTAIYCAAEAALFGFDTSNWHYWPFG